VKVYVYDRCSTCRKAIRFLDERGLTYQLLPIREQPPTQAEFRLLMERGGYSLKQLFNVSGQDYRALNMKERLVGLSESEALDLLSGNGRLVKRPVLINLSSGLVGFSDEAWATLFDQLGNADQS